MAVAIAMSVLCDKGGRLAPGKLLFFGERRKPLYCLFWRLVLDLLYRSKTQVHYEYAMVDCAGGAVSE